MVGRGHHPRVLFRVGVDVDREGRLVAVRRGDPRRHAPGREAHRDAHGGVALRATPQPLERDPEERADLIRGAPSVSLCRSPARAASTSVVGGTPCARWSSCSATSLGYTSATSRPLPSFAKHRSAAGRPFPPSRRPAPGTRGTARSGTGRRSAAPVRRLLSDPRDRPACALGVPRDRRCQDGRRPSAWRVSPSCRGRSSRTATRRSGTRCPRSTWRLCSASSRPARRSTRSSRPPPGRPRFVASLVVSRLASFPAPSAACLIAPWATPRSPSAAARSGVADLAAAAAADPPRTRDPGIPGIPWDPVWRPRSPTGAPEIPGIPGYRVWTGPRRPPHGSDR